jgi:hypothetical protein
VPRLNSSPLGGYAGPVLMTRFWRIFLLGGLPLGVVAGVAASARSLVSWPDLAITVLFSTVVIGTAFGLLTGAVVNHVRRRPLTAALFLLATLTVGVLVTAAVYVGGALLPHGRWERMPDPPEPVAALAGPTCYDLSLSTYPIVYARAQSGRVYRLQGGEGSGAEWVPADSISAHGSERAHYCAERDTTLNRRSPTTPGRVASSHWIRLEGADCGGRVRYVLTAPRSVWRWGTSSCTIGEVGMFVFVVGIAAVWSLVVAYLSIRGRPPLGWPWSGSASNAT